jgi:hypothetical protein
VTERRIKFEISARLPSYHELTGGRNWKIRTAIKREFMTTFFYGIKEGIQSASFRAPRNPAYFQSRVLVHLKIFGRWRGPPDRDNYIQSAGKLIVDQLFDTRTRRAAVRLLLDDRFVEWGTVEFEQGDPKVEVILQEI